MPRPRNQGARRAEIVTAAAAAIAARGLIGLRIKDIAAQAALSPGAVSYYYPELDELLVAVHEAAVGRFFAMRRSEVATCVGPIAKMRRLVDLGVGDLADGAGADPMWTALYELHLNSSRAPRHARLMSDLFELECSLYRDVIELGLAVGDFHCDGDSREIASAAVTLEDGFGLHLVARNVHVDSSSARRTMLSVLAVVLGCPGLADPEETRAG